MKNVMWIGLGGFAGAVLRYAIAGWVQRWGGDGRLPYGTLVVNVIGCLIIGLLSHLAESRQVLPDLRGFVFVGLLGAFTTFPTFGSETLELWQEGRGLLAVANAALNLGLGLAAVWGGRRLAGLIWR